ncbi:MAG: hypothetical protein K0R27_4541 [Xanthobacteraceae bacterium]|jgi:hypothetical protein|nr:hypothetical protein [Xanthobacteraceae bacterium]
MAISSREYDPETVAFLQQCLDVATEAVCRVTGAMPGEDLRQRLAIALMEGADYRIGSRDELIDFALRSMPEFRKSFAS